MQLCGRATRLLLLSCASVAGACGGDDTVVTRDVGTLHFNWTIDGTTDPSLCDDIDASAFEATVFDAGVVDAQVEFPCEAFDGEVRLFVDAYVARTTLVDRRGFPVTNRVVLDQVAIRRNRVTHLEVDFPGDFRGGAGAAGAPD